MTAPPTVGSRILDYKSDAIRLGFIVGGFGGLILLMGPGNLFQSAPEILVPIVVTIVIIGAAIAGYGYVVAASAAATLDARVEAGEFSKKTPADNADLVRHNPNRYFRVSVFFLGFASLGVAAGAWTTYFATL